ncbi:MAG TPA: hypothetical protein VFI31_19090 [Pirellulales bacterium]|nr:hypothetical protein [Pirellulales bacterium]
MPLRNFTQTLLVLGLACQGMARAENPVPAEKPAVAAPRPRAAVTAGNLPRSIDDLDQDALIDDILGLGEGKRQASSATGSSDLDVVACVAFQEQPADAASPPSERRQSSGVLMGRIIGVNLDTSTLNIEFEGRQTTVGSQFSVNHDYPFSTEYLGNVEVVYLAGGNRVIAKPVGRADLTRMGKGDRINGRIVDKKAKDSSSGTSSSGLPVPLPDVETPYVPEDPAKLDSPKPALNEAVQNAAARQSSEAKLQNAQVIAAGDAANDHKIAVAQPPRTASSTLAVPAKRRQSLPTAANKQATTADRRTRRMSGPPLPLNVKSWSSDSGWKSASVQQPSWSAATARSWSALLHTSGRSPQPGPLQAQESRLATAAKVPAKRLWYAVKPKAVTAPSPVQRAASAAGAKTAAPSIVLFEH